MQNKLFKKKIAGVASPAVVKGVKVTLAAANANAKVAGEAGQMVRRPRRVLRRTRLVWLTLQWLGELR